MMERTSGCDKSVDLYYYSPIGDNEFIRLHEASSDDLKPILVLAVETSLRKKELLGLTLARIDLRRRDVRLTVTKTGRPRQVLLSLRALATIRQHS